MHLTFVGCYQGEGVEEGSRYLKSLNHLWLSRDFAFTFLGLMDNFE